MLLNTATLAVHKTHPLVRSAPEKAWNLPAYWMVGQPYLDFLKPKRGWVMIGS
jgi:hypothetical protein